MVRLLAAHGLHLSEGVLPAAVGRTSIGAAPVIPPGRTTYLAEIAATVRGYHAETARQVAAARRLQRLTETGAELAAAGEPNGAVAALAAHARQDLGDDRAGLLEGWPTVVKAYSGDEQVVRIRDRELRTQLTRETLSGNRIPRVALPRYTGHGELLRFLQTSGGSPHAREMSFNDIRTTLQALTAIYDNCNSLHTNAYDEAVTTPGEESVRRALAIQLIINREWGLAANENPLQGSFIIDELTDLVEEAVLTEFDRISVRGGVLGAMETGYQRGRIQDESMLYEHRKHDGSLPVVGVNTFRNPHGAELPPVELARATDQEKRSSWNGSVTSPNATGRWPTTLWPPSQEAARSGDNCSPC